MNIKPLITAVTVTALALAAAPALADHDNGWRGKGHSKYRTASYSNAEYDYARVVRSQPIVRYVTVESPVRECWDDVEYYSSDPYDRGPFNDRTTSTIAGGLLGGVLGRQIGGGKGRDAMTVVGTLIGASIANDRADRRRDARGYATEEYSRPVRRCNTNIETHQEERIEGYRVTYRYNGRNYTTRTNSEPGRRIRVRVDVRPTYN